MPSVPLKVNIYGLIDKIGERGKACRQIYEQSNRGKELLSLKLKSKMSEGSFVCSTCDYSFVCEGLLIAHNRFHMKKEKNRSYEEFEVSTRFSKGSFVCNMCDKNFSCEKLLIAHNRIHVKEEKNSAHDDFEVSLPRPSITEVLRQSSVCEKVVPSSSSSVQGAARVSTRGTSHKPSIIDAFSKNSSSVNKQGYLDNTYNLPQRSNTRCGERNLRNFVCDKCNKRFQHQCSLTSHYRMHSNDVSSQSSRLIKEPCRCGKSASKVSTPGTSYKPSISDAFSKNSSSVKEQGHLDITNCLPQRSNIRCRERNPRKFVSGKCNKRFKYQNTLADHYRMHIKFETAVSNFYFYNYKSYAKAQKPNSCDICCIIFKKKMEHQKHFCLIHKLKGIDEIYCCKECGQSYNKLRKLSAHTRRFHNENLIGCDMCSKRFVTNNDLKRHYMMHVGESSREWYVAKSEPLTVKDPVLVKQEPMEE